MDLHLKLEKPQAEFVAWIAENYPGRTPVDIIEEMVRDGMYFAALNVLHDLPLIQEYPAIAVITRAVVDYGPTPKDGE